MSSKRSLNERYLESLTKYPLLTKSVTAAFLAALNELIAASIAKELKITTVLNQKVKHPFTWKLPVFALFAASVSAPLNHFGLKFINHVIKPPLTLKKKLLQILLTLSTFGPILNILFVSFVAVINLRPHLQSLTVSELKRAFSNVKVSLKKSLFSVVKSSWVTTPLVLTICQTYLQPEYWAVFSNLVYFVLGTGQNTLLKIRNRQNYVYQKKRDDVGDKVEKELTDDDISTNDLSIIEKPSEAVRQESGETAKSHPQ